MNGYYVSALKTRWRGYAVKHAVRVPDLQGRGRTTLVYPTTSRHFTWKAAQKRARLMNAREGRTQ